MHGFQAKAKEYLCKHQLYPSQIAEAPSTRLALVVVIPCHDEPALSETLRALWACARPRCAVEVLVVVNGRANDGADVKRQHRRTLDELAAFRAAHAVADMRLHALDFTALPARAGGVGVARKLGMDTAIIRFCRAGVDDGVIASLDADCRCERNYLASLERHFAHHRRTPACSIYFEHPLDEPNAQRLQAAMTRYELFLRYYRGGLIAARHPHAFYTVGSAMAVRASAYIKQGGMNRREGGEDFYFLAKMFQLGHFTELNDTTVVPAARVSARAAFGTGRALATLATGPEEDYRTYAPASFDELRVLFTRAATLRDAPPAALGLPETLLRYLQSQGFAARLEQMRKHSASVAAFEQRFYRWFDLFRVLKFLRFAGAHAHPPVRLVQAAQELLQAGGVCGAGPSDVANERALLERFRRIDRAGQARSPALETR